MKALKCKPSAVFGGNIWIENTLHAYVLGEYTSTKNELYIVDQQSPGLSIEPRFSTMCIDLSMHVHVVKD